MTLWGISPNCFRKRYPSVQRPCT